MYTDVKRNFVSNYYLFIFPNWVDNNITKSSKNNIQNWIPQSTNEMKQCADSSTALSRFARKSSRKNWFIRRTTHENDKSLETQHEGIVAIKYRRIRFTKFFSLTKASDKPRNIYLIKKAKSFGLKNTHTQSLAGYHTKEPDILLSRKPPNKLKKHLKIVFHQIKEMWKWRL